MLVMLVHLVNAPSPIDVTPEGMLTEARLLRSKTPTVPVVRRFCKPDKGNRRFPGLAKCGWTLPHLVDTKTSVE
jgi:hypothetical protein